MTNPFEALPVLKSVWPGAHKAVMPGAAPITHPGMLKAALSPPKPPSVQIGGAETPQTYAAAAAAKAEKTLIGAALQPPDKTVVMTKGTKGSAYFGTSTLPFNKSKTSHEHVASMQGVEQHLSEVAMEELGSGNVTFEWSRSLAQQVYHVQVIWFPLAAGFGKSMIIWTTDTSLYGVVQGHSTFT